MDLYELIQKYLETGYKEPDAVAKVCQDIILLKIYNSNFKEHITIKGGVVMHSISKDKRRATRDMDLDFIKYSLDDKAIIEFINKLNSVNDGISIAILGNITKLHHQDYDGKRVNIELKDNNNYIVTSKMDIGVHKKFDIEQDDYCFDLNVMNKNISLLINSKEQIFVEKLKSLLKFGIRSTRYKDIFDFYYLINYEKIDKNKLIEYIYILIFTDETMEEKTIEDIVLRVSEILNNKRYQAMLRTANNNWLELPLDIVVSNVLNYIDSLAPITN